MTKNGGQEYGEFKGATEATLKTLIAEVKGMREDINGLKSWRSYTIGVAAAVGFVAGFVKDFVIRKP